MAGGRDQKLTRVFEKLGAKTMDISQFLVGRTGAGIYDCIKSKDDSRLPKVTYHDPCHLKKSLAVEVEPRDLIVAAGHRLVEMPNADACCGMGGSFNLKYYQMSRQIGFTKLSSILAAKAPVVATSCPACMAQLADILSRAGCRIKVKHVIQLYADALLPG